MASRRDSFTIDEQVANSAEDLVTTITGERKTIQGASVHNTHSSAVTVTVYRRSAAAGGSNIADKVTLQQDETAVVIGLLNQTIKDGQAISAVATVNNVVNIHLSGVTE